MCKLLWYVNRGMGQKRDEAENAPTSRLASNSICVRLAEARQARGMTFDELARAADLSDTAVAYLERGERLPRTDTVERLARALRVSRSWLAFGDGHKPDFRSPSKACAKCGHSE